MKDVVELDPADIQAACSEFVRKAKGWASAKAELYVNTNGSLQRATTMTSRVEKVEDASVPSKRSDTK
jgi:hypothetical protein